MGRACEEIEASQCRSKMKSLSKTERERDGERTGQSYEA